MIEELHRILDHIEHEWTGKRLLVIGDLMLDKYIWGSVERISPEAPVPVVRAARTSNQPGGAANVAMNLVRLGARVELAGFIGDDQDGALLVNCLQENEISPHCVVSSGFPTISKLRIIGGRQQILRLDTEVLGARPCVDQSRLLEIVAARLPYCDAVVLSDYAKGVLSEDLCRACISQARTLCIPVLVDPKSADFTRYRGATTICPNLAELSKAVRLDSQNLDELLSAAQKLIESCNLDFMTATLSEKGIALLRPSGRFLAPAAARQVFDVSGAGDTVIALLALCLASKLEPEIGVQLANIAAGVVVGKVGTVPIEKHELLAALTPEIALHAEDKVVSLDELIGRLSLWRKNGERIVFTNGCFDLLHVGHIVVIEQARGFGDRLIVAINSDESVSRLKGPSRPIVGQAERARVLAALGAVDAVIVFDDPTPLNAILATRPDVIVKGGDYNPQNVVGAREVESWGGHVRIVPTIDGFSTTKLIDKGRNIQDV